MSHDPIAVPTAPPIPGLSFRRFRGEADYPAMVAILLSCAEADQIERHDTVEDLARRYSQLSNDDIYQNTIFAEIDGDVAGYGRCWWWEEPGAGRLYGLVIFVEPHWRGRGIGLAMLLWMESRLREVAAAHPPDQSKNFQADVAQHQDSTRILLERAGYRPARYFFEMVRPTMEDIPNAPLPGGAEVRPALPADYRSIWASIVQTSQEEWGYTPPTEENYQAWLNDETHFQPELWQIAWDTASDRVVGHVLTFIDRVQNEQLGRKRGYTEGIGVDPAWRRRGLARALIARSLQAQKAAGMTESAMLVDSDNASGATRLYESCGFQIVSQNTVYRKPV